jgi:uncharacterized protein YbcC (UPF0753/DUF2309 family)
MMLLLIVTKDGQSISLNELSYLELDDLQELCNEKYEQVDDMMAKMRAPAVEKRLADAKRLHGIWSNEKDWSDE